MTPSPRRPLVASILIAGAGAGWPASSASQQTVASTQLVWPAPPELARVRFTGSLATEVDIGRKESFMRRVRRVMVGGRREGMLRVQRPYDVYAESPDRVYVSDGLTQAILLFDRKEKEARFIGADIPGGLQKPMGIGAGGAGRVLIADQGARRAVMVDRAGAFIRSFGGPELLVNPVDVAADTVTGRVYVVDSHLHQVVVFDAEGRVVQRLGRKRTDAVGLRAELALPVEVTHESPGGATESVGPHRARTHDALENRGEGPGEFKYPYSVAVAEDGTVYVADQMNFRILVFNREGAFLRQIGKVGTQPGQFARPKGVAVDAEGHLYVADAAFNNVQVFQSDGALLLAFGSGGDGPGRQILPLGLAVDGTGHIYLADRFNNRIQIYQYLRPPPTSGQE